LEEAAEGRRFVDGDERVARAVCGCCEEEKITGDQREAQPPTHKCIN
jgi:hypothetical protein